MIDANVTKAVQVLSQNESVSDYRIRAHDRGTGLLHTFSYESGSRGRRILVVEISGSLKPERQNWMNKLTEQSWVSLGDWESAMMADKVIINYEDGRRQVVKDRYQDTPYYISRDQRSTAAIDTTTRP